MNKGRDFTSFGDRNRRSSTRCKTPGPQDKRRRLNVVHKETCERAAIAIKAHGSADEIPARTVAGAVVGDLDVFTRRELRLPNEIHGIVVHHVPENSPAHKAGLRSGDIITEINRSSVLNTDHALTAAESWKDARILLEVWTEKGLRHVTIYKP